jgi:hypothetical protein
MPCFPLAQNFGVLAKAFGISQPLVLQFRPLFELPPAYLGDLTVDHRQDWCTLWWLEVDCKGM